jgi:hypothetical protein
MQPRAQGGSGEERQARDVVKRDVRCVELDNVGEPTRAVARPERWPARTVVSQPEQRRARAVTSLRFVKSSLCISPWLETNCIVRCRCTLAQSLTRRLLGPPLQFRAGAHSHRQPHHPQNTALATAVKCVVLHPPAHRAQTNALQCPQLKGQPPRVANPLPRRPVPLPLTTSTVGDSTHFAPPCPVTSGQPPVSGRVVQKTFVSVVDLLYGLVLVHSVSANAQLHAWSNPTRC